MASHRRVGSTTSKTRQRLLDSVEQLMVDQGYAAVTYRAVAAAAGVTAGLVQYYFPTLDDLLVAAVRRRSEQNLERLEAALAGDEHPLRVLWDYSNHEATAALTIEFMALANHRESIRAEIAEMTKQVRKLQFDALAGRIGSPGLCLELTPSAVTFLVNAVPKLLQLEASVGIDAGHVEIIEVIEQLLGATEP